MNNPDVPQTIIFFMRDPLKKSSVIIFTILITLFNSYSKIIACSPHYVLPINFDKTEYIFLGPCY